MQNKPFRLGPVAIAAAAANVLNPGTTTGGVNSGTPGNLYIILTHLRFVNKTALAVTFSAYLGATGATAAGTEVIGTLKSIAASDVYDWYGRLLINAVDFLVMVASGAASITVEGEGEIGVAT